MLSRLWHKQRPREDRLILGLILWFAACFSAAAFGAAFQPGGWYAALNKPSWTPPAAVFGPVWTVLYAMMAVAAWMVWKEGGFSRQRRPLILFGAQLLLNAIWSPLCFGLHSLLLSSIAIVLLACLLVYTVKAFFGVNRLSGWLLVPYLAWVTYAATLNIGLLVMN